MPEWFIDQCKAKGFAQRRDEPFTLASGRQSHVYFDVGAALLDGDTKDEFNEAQAKMQGPEGKPEAAHQRDQESVGRPSVCQFAHA